MNFSNPGAMSEADYLAGKRPNGDAQREDVKPQQAPPQDDAATKESHSLRPLTVEELLFRPAPKWIVRGLMVERGLAVMFGASGSGKTFAALDLACAIARGQHWFGRRVRAGGVIYVAGEGHLKLRIEAYLAHHDKLDPRALLRLRIVPATINLLRDESGDLETLIAEIKKVAHELGGVVLVVLDTLNAMMPGGNENASEDMGTMIAAARRLMVALDCAALYIHHSGKDESKGSRGHSSLKAAVDVEMQVSGEGERLLEAVKVRDGEPGQRFGFRLHPVDLGPDPDPEAEHGERLDSCAVVPLDHAPTAAKRAGKRRDVALDAQREAISEQGQVMPGTSTIPPGVKAVTIAQWKTRWLLRTGYEPGRSADAAFSQDKKRLLAAGKIGVSAPYVWMIE